MLSRVANDIYWMHRYIERADNYARFLDVNFNLSLEMPTEHLEQWRPLVVTTGDWELYNQRYNEVEKENVIYFLGFDPENPNSIYNSIVKARENARSVRPEITKEVWEQVNYLFYMVNDGLEKKLWLNEDPRDFFILVKNGCQLFYGIFDSTISRTDGWHFGKMGQLVERADKTSRVLDVKYHMLLPRPEAVGSPIDLIQWAALLKSVSAYDMYRKKNGKLIPAAISEFLILDKNFPRSIFRCLTIVEESMQFIMGNNGSYSNNAKNTLGRLKSQLEFVDINDIFNEGLHEYLDTFQLKLNEVSSALYETFFSSTNIRN